LKFDIDTDKKIPWLFLAVSPPLLLGDCAAPEQRTLVDESGMIRTQMGSTIDQKMVAVAWDALYDTTPKQ
jgi:hypothetical protein